MKIRTYASIKMPDIGKIPDKTTQMVMQQLVSFLQQNQTFIHDDLASLSVGRASALPVASADLLGKFYQKINTNALDTLHLCIYDGATNTYTWKTVSLT